MMSEIREGLLFSACQTFIQKSRAILMATGKCQKQGSNNLINSYINQKGVIERSKIPGCLILNK